MTNMTAKQAAFILDCHNKWRRGDDYYAETNPVVLGVAIDVAIEALTAPRVPELVAVTSHREAFEAFYAKQLGRSELSETFSRAGEDYVVSHTQRAWKAWYYGAHHQTQLLTKSGQMLAAATGESHGDA